MRRLVLATMLAGCDSLADADYAGEPMLRVTGTVASKATTYDEAELEVALMWQDPRGAGGPGIAETIVPATFHAPATIRLAIPVPPPDEARFVFGDDPVALAEAYVHLVAPGDLAARIRGLARTHVVVFATDDVAEGTRAAQYMGGPMPAGYHLRRFAPVPAPGPAQLELVERCAASGENRSACEARRAYQLQPADDADHLRIVVWPT